MFQKLFSLFTSSKRRKYKGTKRGKASGKPSGKASGKRSSKRRTRRVYPKDMRGGWGENMTTQSEMFRRGGIMKGGWGGTITSPIPI